MHELSIVPLTLAFFLCKISLSLLYFLLIFPVLGGQKGKEDVSCVEDTPLKDRFVDIFQILGAHIKTILSLQSTDGFCFTKCSLESILLGMTRRKNVYYVKTKLNSLLDLLYRMTQRYPQKKGFKGFNVSFFYVVMSLGREAPPLQNLKSLTSVYILSQ